MSVQMMVIIRQTIVSSYNTDSIYLKTINGHESILVVGCCVGVVGEVINHPNRCVRSTCLIYAVKLLRITSQHELLYMLNLLGVYGLLP